MWNGHLAVIHDYDEIVTKDSGLVQARESFAPAQRAIADERDHIEFLAFQIPGPGQAKGQRDCRGCVARVKKIVFRRFGRQRVFAYNRIRLRFCECRHSTREHFSGTDLMAYIPYKFVIWSES